MLPMSSDNWAMASQANAWIEASISSAVSWSCGCGSDMITRDSSSTQDEKLSLGFRDIASGPRCQRPGLCWILKRYLRVLSLILNNLGLVTSARLRCPSIATRGWWSVVTMRDGQPRINILHFSKLQAIAAASLAAAWLLLHTRAKWFTLWHWSQVLPHAGQAVARSLFEWVLLPQPEQERCWEAREAYGSCICAGRFCAAVGLGPLALLRRYVDSLTAWISLGLPSLVWSRTAASKDSACLIMSSNFLKVSALALISKDICLKDIIGESSDELVCDICIRDIFFTFRTRKFTVLSCRFESNRVILDSF